MKKRVLFILALLMCISFAGGVKSSNSAAAKKSITISKKNFPDKKFRSYIRRKFDKNKNGKLSEKEIKKIRTLEVVNVYSETKIDYQGIEYFTYLERLYLRNIEKIDLSKNRNLTSLTIANANLTKINLTKNKKLDYLEVENCKKIRKMDLSKNSKLRILHCSRNKKMKEISFPEKSELYDVYLPNNALQKLDVKNAKKLEYIECTNNQIKTLYVNQTPKLKDLYCGNNVLTKLDISNCPNLTDLQCFNNQLKELSLINNTKLLGLDCGRNLITKIDISMCSQLKDQFFSHDPIVQVTRGA